MKNAFRISALLASFGLTAGAYYWRAAALDATGREGRWSESRRFRIVAEDFRDPDDTVPPSLHPVSSSAETPASKRPGRSGPSVR